jgi:drug/metabolite transporter (DMT)-like permease
MDGFVHRKYCQPDVSDKMLSVACYCICSSLMLILNKKLLALLAASSAVIFVQIFFSALSTGIVLLFGKRQVERFQVDHVLPFFLIVGLFVISLHSSAKALQGGPVTFLIVLRACSPFFVAASEFFFLQREFLTRRSLLALLCVGFGACLYADAEKRSKIDSITLRWGLLWFSSLIVSQIYVKHVCNTTQLSTTTQVFYTNVLSVVPFAIMALVSPESIDFMHAIWRFDGAFWLLLLSCLLGTCLSFSSYHLRALISATTFDLIGVACKCVTIALDIMLFKTTFTYRQASGLFICIMAAALYEQAPLRSPAASVPKS